MEDRTEKFGVAFSTKGPVVEWSNKGADEVVEKIRFLHDGTHSILIFRREQLIDLRKQISAALRKSKMEQQRDEGSSDDAI